MITDEGEVGAAATSSSMPRCCSAGLGRATKPRIGMLTSRAMPAASGAQTTAATAPAASSRQAVRRTRHQVHTVSRTRPRISPYSPAKVTTRSTQSGAVAARPLMS
ncbi:hypothetical protein ACFQVA_21915 [Actinomadura keratinilytica]